MRRKPHLIFSHTIRSFEGKAFDSGILWELYMDLERQFQDFLNYVPFYNNEATYSYRLLNLILSIGGHVDSAFKEMARFPDFAEDEDCKKILELLRISEENVSHGKAPKTIPMRLPLEVFEKIYKLSEKRVIFHLTPEDLVLTPFKPDSDTKIPEWWDIYNGLKHDVGVRFQQANLKNTACALAGAFLLNVIHEPAILRLYDRDLLDWSFGGHMIRQQFEDMIHRKQTLFCSVRTKLFIYDFEQKTNST
jgi:hypothetical protein